MRISPFLRTPITLTEAELKVRLAALETMCGVELRQEYRRVWRTEPYSHNYATLRSRIAWRLRTMCYGGLAPETIEQAHRIADLSQFRERRPASKDTPKPKKFIPQFTPVAPRSAAEADGAGGSTASQWMSNPNRTLIKWHKGKEYPVHTQDGEKFYCEGYCFASLSAVARHISGYKCNGNTFFSTNTRFIFA